MKYRAMKSKRRYLLPGILLLLIVYLAVNVCSIVFYSGKDETRDADAAIVLGAAADDSGVSEVFRQRLEHSVKLYEDGTVNTIIVTGGVGSGNTLSDAEIGKEYLLGRGIPDEVILVEGNSTITQKNLENAKAIMEENGMETALIVSDPLHMKRAMLLAKDAGLTAYSSPTGTSAYRSLKTRIPFAARETFFYIGYKWYRIFVR